MIEIRDEVVYRRIWNRGGLGTQEARLLWRTVLANEVPVRRTLINADTGEIIDDVWLDGDGRVRSWSCVAGSSNAARDPATLRRCCAVTSVEPRLMTTLVAGRGTAPT